MNKQLGCGVQEITVKRIITARVDNINDPGVYVTYKLENSKGDYIFYEEKITAESLPQETIGAKVVIEVIPVDNGDGHFTSRSIKVIQRLGD